MKIVCDKEEFWAIANGCRGCVGEGCDGCALHLLCMDSGIADGLEGTQWLCKITEVVNK